MSDTPRKPRQPRKKADPTMTSIKNLVADVKENPDSGTPHEHGGDKPCENCGQVHDVNNAAEVTAAVIAASLGTAKAPFAAFAGTLKAMILLVAGTDMPIELILQLVRDEHGNLTHRDRQIGALLLQNIG